MKTVLITGATSGIGKASAELLAKHSYKLIICGRRQDRLLELKNQLASKTEVYTLNFDVRLEKEVNNAIESLPASWKTIDVLINNAGNAHGLAPLHKGDTNDWDAMIDINVKGLLYISKAILPGMVKRCEGQILNIGSIAGKEVYKQGNVYCASKHAVDAITKGLRMDLNEYNIRVGAVNPGLVDTEFSLVRFKGDRDKANKVYEGFSPLLAEDIAEIIWFAISRPPHVNIADLLVLPTAQSSATQINRNQ